jgi:hypothetical protein
MEHNKRHLMGSTILIGFFFSVLLQASETTSSTAIPFRMDNKWGYVDKNKKIVVDFKYDETRPFSDGLGLVKLNGKCGYIDKTGNEVIDLQYKYCLPFKNGIAEISDLHGYINKKGQKIDNQEMAKIVGHPVAFEKNGKFGLIDKNGLTIVSPKYDDIGEIIDGFAQIINKVSDKYLYGLIDEKGNVIFPPRYENLEILSNGYISVKQNGLYGIIDKKEKIIIPFEYDYVGDYSEGLFVARKNQKSGYVNKKNEVVIPLKYDYASQFINGLASAHFDGKGGYIDKNGNTVIPFIYGTTRQFNNGLAWVQQSSNNSTDAINSSGYIDIHGVEYFHTNNKVSLFGMNPIGATRSEIRQNMKRSGVMAIREDDNFWYDKYDTKSIVEGTSEMSIGYTSAGTFAEFKYTFPSHANPKTFKEVYEKVSSKYGKSPWYLPYKESSYDRCAGDFQLGESRCQWFVNGLVIDLKRDWPDTTVNLSYQSLDYEKMNSEIAEAENERKSKKQIEQQKYL